MCIAEKWNYGDAETMWLKPECALSLVHFPKLSGWKLREWKRRPSR